MLFRSLDFSEAIVQGVAFVLLEEGESAIQESLLETESEASTSMRDFNLNNIRIKKGIPQKEALIDVMEYFFPGTARDRVEAAMAKIGIIGFSKVRPGLKREFTDHMLRENFSRYSGNIIRFVGDAFCQVLGLPRSESRQVMPDEANPATGQADVMRRIAGRGNP